MALSLNEPKVMLCSSTCQTRLNGGSVTTPIKLVSAKNCTCAIEPSGSLAYVLTLIRIPSLNESSCRGHKTDTSGGRLLPPDCAWAWRHDEVARGASEQTVVSLANFFIK